MGTIVPFLRGADEAFDPKDITAMSMALVDVCKAPNLRDDSPAREVIAHIIELAKFDERSLSACATGFLHEAGLGGHIGMDTGPAGTADITYLRPASR